MASEAAARPAASGAPVPHIALLLPLKSKTFARHAAALRDGFQAAAKVQGRTPLPVREYAVAEAVGEVLAGYRAAVAAGAQVVVGPLTRDAVTALAFGEPVPVPTLALNAPDSVGRLPGLLFSLNLQIEAEARALARLALRDGRRSAVTLGGTSPVLRRMQAAFSSEFLQRGGTIKAEITYAADPEKLQAVTRAVADADMLFLALDFSEARAARTYAGSTPAYATSGVHVGDAGPLAGFDLAGVSFVDMPWLLDPNHAAVMIYPRPAPRLAYDLERLYALGIDAWRIAQVLLAGERAVRLDGVTGQLTLGADGQFERDLPAGRYLDGRPQMVEPAAREPAR